MFFDRLEDLVNHNTIVHEIVNSVSELTGTLTLPGVFEQQQVSTALKRVFVLALEQHLFMDWSSGRGTPIINELFTKGIAPAEQHEMLNKMLQEERFHLTKSIVLNDDDSAYFEKSIARSNFPVLNGFAEYVAKIVPSFAPEAREPHPQTREINRRVVLGQLITTDSRLPNSVEHFPGLLNHNRPLSWANHLVAKNMALIRGINPRDIDSIESALQEIGKTMFWIYSSDSQQNDPYKQYTVRIPKPSGKVKGAAFTRDETEYGKAILFIKGELSTKDLKRYYPRQLPIGAIKSWEKLPDQELLKLSESNLFIDLT